MALEQRIAAFQATCGLLGWKFLFVATGTPLCFSLLFLRAQLDRTDFFVDDFRVTLGCEFRAEKLAVDVGEDTWRSEAREEEPTAVEEQPEGNWMERRAEEPKPEAFRTHCGMNFYYEVECKRDYSTQRRTRM